MIRLITIIIPVYNAESWLPECISSVLSQTISDLEVILIDDGSNDKSCEMCDSFMQKDERVRVFHTENKGVSSARNLGLQQARGDYIQFLDSDDWLEPDACEKLTKAIERADLVLCGLNIWQADKIIRSPHLPLQTFMLRDNIENYFLLRRINLGPCNKLYKKELITKGFVEDISLGEDTLFVMDYMKNIQTVMVLPDCLYNVRLDNPGSLNRKQREDKLELLLKLRKQEESCLCELYGDGFDRKKINGEYLLTTHACCLDMSTTCSFSSFRSKIKPYFNMSFLRTRILGTTVKRIDHRIFQLLYKYNMSGFIYFYSRLKILVGRLHLD